VHSDSGTEHLGGAMAVAQWLWSGARHPRAGHGRRHLWLGAFVALTATARLARAGCSEPRPAPGAQHTFLFDFGQRQHEIILNFPPGYLNSSGREAWPLLFSLHGSGGVGFVFHDYLRLHEVVLEPDVTLPILVTPSAGTRLAGLETMRIWNVQVNGTTDPLEQDDVAFLSALLDILEATFCVDRRRIYAAGHSNGARMASKLGCELGGRLAAVAAVGGVRYPQPCICPAPTPVLALHAVADVVNPYHDGGPNYWVTGVEHAMTGWAERNQCSPGFTITQLQDVSLAECISFDCHWRREAILMRYQSTAHLWDRMANASVLVLRFLLRHSLPEAVEIQPSSRCGSTVSGHDEQERPCGASRDFCQLLAGPAVPCSSSITPEVGPTQAPRTQAPQQPSAAPEEITSAAVAGRLAPLCAAAAAAAWLLPGGAL